MDEGLDMEYLIDIFAMGICSITISECVITVTLSTFVVFPGSTAGK